MNIELVSVQNINHSCYYVSQIMISLKTLFFVIDKLHIQSSERYFLTGFILLYALTWLVQPMIPAKEDYNDEYYAPIMEAFYNNSAEKYSERRETLQRYYPDDEDKIMEMAAKVLPAGYEQEVLLRAMKNKQEHLANESPVNQVVPISAAMDSTKKEGENRKAGVNTEKINLNKAGLLEFTRLPGIGRSIAERIVEYREQNGSFKRIEDIMKVRGIGPARFDKFKHMLEV